MTAALRRAQASDGPVMGAILQGWIEDTPWMPVLHSLEDTQRFCAGLVQTAGCWVAEDAGKVCGFVAAQQGWVHALYLAPDARRRGVGSALLKQVQRDAEELQLWCFQANEAAQRFYAASGFHIAEKTDGQGNAEKLPDIRYIWRRTRGEME
ncbi:GNAT family N-acetyltransferase [Shimia sp. MMG029]|uniref:GNAT family N-acetyltransferase n=1 Tax=Shimia sp. MMG029 TaxID=3021978 RepID=UPI0022FF428C|nr:GNAT family N-acetyltransferase [Shimia sp. MMG029]MDA5557118.1 GNAT family N-acetyltransferase [Shimia sp. MMG029]